MAAYDAFARFYDALTDNIDYPARAAYFSGLLADYGADRAAVLDLACGTGRLALELARLGHRMIGADASAEMLAVAFARAEGAGADILFLQQDMTELDLYGDVDAAVCALDSLNHLANGGALARAMARVALFLRPGGLFVFDMNTPYKHKTVLANHTFVYDTKEVYCVWQNHTRGNTTRVMLDFFVPTHAPDGYRRCGESFTERAFSEATLSRALGGAGLELLARYDADTRHPPNAESERIVYVAQKL